MYIYIRGNGQKATTRHIHIDKERKRKRERERERDKKVIKADQKATTRHGVMALVMHVKLAEAYLHKRPPKP